MPPKPISRSQKVAAETQPDSGGPLAKYTQPYKAVSDSGRFGGRRPFGMVLFGGSGVGKTSFGANFPNAGFICDPQEEGILDLLDGRNPPPKPTYLKTADSWLDLFDKLDDLATGPRKCDTLFLDSGTGLEKLCFAYHCAEHFEGNWSSKGFYAYQQGPKNAAKTDWPGLLDKLEAVRTNGINVSVICHTQVKTFNNPEGPDYDRYTPYLDKEIWQHLHRWASMVLFYNFKVDLEKSKSQTVKSKVKGDSEQRFIYTEWSPSFDAKNRFNLEPLIDAGSSGKSAYEAFRRVYTQK